MEYGLAGAERQSTEVKRDADYIGNRLQEILSGIIQCNTDLERQGNKLFGHQPKPDDPKTSLSPEQLPILDLLDYIDKAVTELRNQTNRF